MTEAENLFSRRGQLLETIAVASDEIKAIDARLEFLRSIEFEEDTAAQAHMKQGLALAPGLEIIYVVKDIKK